MPASALPFAFSGLELSYTDAFFEAMSGVTTTGSTVITQLDRAPTTLEVLPPIVDAVGDRAEVLMDGGVMSGSDIAVACRLQYAVLEAVGGFINHYEREAISYGVSVRSSGISARTP